MSADSLLQLLTQLLFFGIFVAVLARAIRRPLASHVDTAVFFGVIALLVIEQWIQPLIGDEPGPIVSALNGGLFMALPYLMLRLLDDFAGVPPPVKRTAEAGLALSVLGLFLARPLPPWATLLYVAYFLALQLYVAVAFVREAARSSGVTRRRLQTVALGSAFLGLLLLVVGLQVALPGLRDLWSIGTRLAGLAAGLCYFLGFAPPGVLRRAWQEPELRAFLGRAAALPRLATTAAIIAELERGAALSLGVPKATIGTWDEESGAIRFSLGPLRPGELTAGRAFQEQRPLFTQDAPAAFPSHRDLYERSNFRAVMAAPITAGQKRLGVLVASAPRAPLFAEDDLVLLQLLADQAAVVLESRALIDQAARVRAREEMTRLRDDFLSSVAHDLKTPLTTLVAQAQLLERRTQLKPDAPADMAGIRRLVSEATRLRGLVLELLDASRAEHGRLIAAKEPVDLTEVARRACERHNVGRDRCRLEAASRSGGAGDRLAGDFDRTRIEQLFDNLIANAVKYSPEGGDVEVRLWREGDEAHITVTDQGIGIPTEDLPRLFQRFHRGSNVDDRRFAGMGLGLYICRGIVEEHGGRIWATSRVGAGSTFHVALPLAPASAPVPIAGSAT
ncbi:MAG TPA: ATP-binding protein [Chloroflexota bacterium]|jgi:signal transduction histidine kinase|nr:ATP-binding protein [Chloroflexota bacterium]